MASCPRAGCSGTIEDGYCDTCGMAAVAPAASTAPTPAPSTRTAAGVGPTGSGRTGPGSSSTLRTWRTIG